MLTIYIRSYLFVPHRDDRYNYPLHPIKKSNGMEAKAGFTTKCREFSKRIFRKILKNYFTTSG